MDYTEEIIRLGKEMREKSQNIHKKLYRAPEGSILIYKEDGKLKLYQLTYNDGKQKRTGIKLRPDIVKALVWKAYYSEKVSRLDHNITVLRNAVSNMLPMDYGSIIRCMPKNFELLGKEYLENWNSANMHPVFDDSISPADYQLFIPEEERSNWGTKPYRANSLFIDNKQNQSEDGHFFRSKNEMSIFSCYQKYDIPTHYDELLRFQWKLLSPDFVSLREDGKIIFHEHCGLVNNADYMKKHKEKLEIYEQCGIVPYDNLIISYENEFGGINMNLIEAQIRSMHRL